MNRQPIVLDVDDIMTAPEIVIQYCNFVDLDPSKLKFNWKPMESDELENIDPEFLRIKDTLHTSDGARQGRVVAGIVLENVKWRQEFGGTGAAKLVGGCKLLCLIMITCGREGSLFLIERVSCYRKAIRNTRGN
jgi:hypothetical protein